jgi:hypothetical protein
MEPGRHVLLSYPMLLLIQQRVTASLKSNRRYNQNKQYFIIVQATLVSKMNYSLGFRDIRY